MSTPIYDELVREQLVEDSLFTAPLEKWEHDLLFGRTAFGEPRGIAGLLMSRGLTYAARIRINYLHDALYERRKYKAVEDLMKAFPGMFGTMKPEKATKKLSWWQEVRLWAHSLFVGG